MRSLATFLYIFLVAAVRGAPTTSDLYVLYSNSNYNIIVKDLNSGTTVNTFTLRVEKPTFIVMDYENDILFYTTDDAVYQIYLVDEYGNRKISGKGELFTNPLADHIETVFYRLNSFKNIKGFIFDSGVGVLYLFCPYYKEMGDYFLKLDSQNGKLLSSGRIQFTASRYVLYNRMLYATSHDRGCTHLASVTLEDLNKELGWKWMELQKCWTPHGQFTVDKITNRLFFVADKNTIRLLDGDLTRTPIGSMEDRYVISDSEVSKDINDISVHGEVVVWSSSSWEKIYLGLLNKKMSFMSKKNVRVLDVKHSGFDNILIFRTGFITEVAPPNK